MKVLVTGGCGFIGHHLVDELVDQDHEVIVIDNLSADNDKFYINDKAKYVFADIREDLAISKYFRNVNHVFHLAAEARIQPSIENPKQATSVNVLGTLSVLQACVENNVKRITYSSTSSVYGLTTQFPTSETTPLDCLNPYATSKLGGEELVKCFTKIHGLDACILRYFNVFGEESPVTGPYSLVIGIFLSQLKSDLPLTVVGDGLNLRDFVYVKDVASVNILTMNHQDRLNGEIFNIGSGTTIAILEVAQLISRNITFIPHRVGEARTTLADINKAKSVLGWTPKTTLIEWLKSQ